MAPLTSSRTAALEAVEELRPRLLRLAHLFRRQSTGLPVTMTQGAVLRHLALAGRPLRMGELAQLEGVQMPTMTQLVARLQAIGLVTRTMAAADRRAVEVSLTERGRDVLDLVVAERRRLLADRLARLSSSELEALLAALPALDHLLEQP